MNVVFLDRDGVINRNPKPHHYIISWKKFIFLPKIKESIKLLNENDSPVIVLTNRAGINKKLFSRSDLKKIHDRMQDELKRAGAHIDAIFYCPHRPDENCPCRKAKSSLFKEAGKQCNIDFKESWMVGSDQNDVEAGKGVGCEAYMILKE